ncbi:insulinase family protein [candidate division KSB1 bacterium]|nr:insulinase family protein [candidate division KSB1 bacterium]
MRSFILICIFMMIIFSLSSGQPVRENFFPYQTYQKVLSNGLKVIVIPMQNPGLVAYYSIVRTGSRDEYEHGHSGFAHFFEHMMFRGTKKYPGPVYDRIMTEMGANANAFTSSDLTCFHIVHSKDHLDQVLELESDRFQNLDYEVADFKTEAGAVLGEYLKGLSSPWSLLREKLMETAFTTHTYRHTTIGFRQDVEAMPTMYDYSRSFFNRYYRPENVILLLVGDLNPDETFVKVQQYYGNWQPGYVPPAIQPEPEQTAERSAELTFSGKTLPIMTIAYKAPAFSPTDKALAASYLLGALLFGENSEIYKKLVIREQSVQFIQANFFANRDPGLFQISTMIKNENDIPQIKGEIDRTIQQAQTEPIALEKLKNQQRRIRYAFLMELDTAQKTAGRLVSFLALSGELKSVDEFFATCDAVTPEDLQAAAQKFLVLEKRTAITLKGGNN